MSDFWADLQRWTEARVAAILRGRIGAKRNDYIAADINKLLRDRIQDPLTIKVGDKVLAEFLRTAGRAPPKYVLELGPVEHGWLTGSTGAWTIYTWSSLAAYLAGQGISIGADGEYASTITGRVTPTAGVDDPERYSGLMRLLVQSLVGAGRHVTDIMPLANPPYDGNPYWQFTGDIHQVGLMRGPDQSYWLIKAVINEGDAGHGVYAVKLTFPEELDWLIALANGGTLSPSNQAYADSWILSQAIKPTTSTIKILSRSGFLPLFGDGFAGSISYRHQARGASDELSAGASGASNRSPMFAENLGRYRYDTRQLLVRHGSLAITWSGGAPSASLTVDTEGYSNEFGQPNDALNLGEGSVIFCSRTLTRRICYDDDAYLVTDPVRTGEKVFACWWGEDGTEQKLIHVDAEPSPGNVVSSSGGDDSLAFGTVSWNNPDPPDRNVWSLYTATRQLYGWAVAGIDLSTISVTRNDSDETVSCEVTQTADLATYTITYDKVLTATVFDWHDDHARPEIHAFIGPPGLVWIVRRGYTRRVVRKTFQKTTIAYMSRLSNPDQLVNFTIDICPLATYTGTSGLELISEENLESETVESAGYIINGSSVTAMSEAAANALCDLADTMAGTTYTSTTRMACYPGYNGRVNVKYLALSAGLDADGAALAGRWIGAA